MAADSRIVWRELYATPTRGAKTMKTKLEKLVLEEGVEPS